MERISGDGFFSYRREVKSDSPSGKRTGKIGRKRSFSSELESVEEGGILPEIEPDAGEAEAAELLDAVFEAGDHLKRHTDQESLVRYKTAVKRFISIVVKRALDVEQNISGSNVLKKKRYALITVIDGKLEKLAAAMVNNQRNQIEFLASIDEINGLIVDLRR